jgi:hypothetical protein
LKEFWPAPKEIIFVAIYATAAHRLGPSIVRVRKVKSVQVRCRGL